MNCDTCHDVGETKAIRRLERCSRMGRIFRNHHIQRENPFKVCNTWSALCLSAAVDCVPGLRARIDPEQIPSPVDVSEYDAEAWAGKQYMTLPGGHVPLSTTDFVSIDQGVYVTTCAMSTLESQGSFHRELVTTLRSRDDVAHTALRCACRHLSGSSCCDHTAVCGAPPWRG